MLSTTFSILCVGLNQDEQQRLQQACAEEPFALQSIPSFDDTPPREDFDPSLIVVGVTQTPEEAPRLLASLGERSRHIFFAQEADWPALSTLQPLACLADNASVEEIRFRLHEALHKLTLRQGQRLGSPLLSKNDDPWAIIPTADWVTGLDNRARFLQELKKNISRALRYKRPFCCLLAQLNNETALRNAQEPDALDQIFEDIGGLIEMSIRDADVVAHIQPSLFGVILTETPAEAANVVVQRIDERIQAYAQTQSLRLSFSFAIAPFDPSQPTIEAILAHAQDQLPQPSESP